MTLDTFGEWQSQYDKLYHKLEKFDSKITQRSLKQGKINEKFSKLSTEVNSFIEDLNKAQLSSEKVQPLIRQLQTKLDECELHKKEIAAFGTIAKTTARKGKAWEASVGVAQKLWEGGVLPTGFRTHSANPVHVLPQAGAVLKFAEQQARQEEENIIEYMLQIYLPESGFSVSVPSYAVHTLEPERLGLEPPRFDYGYDLYKTDSDLVEALIKKGQPHAREIVRELQKKRTKEVWIIPHVPPGLQKVYEDFSKKTWYFTKPDGEKEDASFKEIQKAFLKGTDISTITFQDKKSGENLAGKEYAQFLECLEVPWRLISPHIYEVDYPHGYLFTHISPETIKGISQHFSKNEQPDVENLFQQIKKDPQMRKQAWFVPFVPADLQSDYEKFSTMKWELLTQNGNLYIASFKDVQALMLEGEINSSFMIRAVGDQDFQPIQQNQRYPQLDRCLQVQWILIPPQTDTLGQSLQTYVAEQKRLTPVSHVHVKPFIENMTLIDSYESMPRVLEMKLSRLTPEAEKAACLTLELEFQDLHYANLGLRLVTTESSEQYMKQEFQYYNPSMLGTKSFQDVMGIASFENMAVLYHGKKINEDTLLIFGSEEKQLRDMPELLSSLKNARWELCLFDTDRSFGETNALIRERGPHGIFSTRLPLRSCLLATTWATRALSPQCREELRASDEQDRIARQWMLNMDSSLYQRMSGEDKDRISLLAVKTLENLPGISLAENRQKDGSFTLQQLRASLAQKLAECTEDTKEFWSEVEAIVQKVGWPPTYHTVSKEDTSQGIRGKYHLEEVDLKRLNPTVEKLSEVKKLVIRPPLTENSPVAAELRKEIATNFIPRVSVDQCGAFLERIEAKNTYLDSYQKISKMQVTQGNGMEIRDTLLEALKAMPFSTAQKNEYVEKLQQIPESILKGSAPVLSNLLKEIQEAGKPTYLNLTKVMYPVIADFYELAEYMQKLGYKFQVPIGDLIGNPYFSVEKFVSIVNGLIKQNSGNQAVVDRLTQLRSNFLAHK